MLKLEFWIHIVSCILNRLTRPKTPLFLSKHCNVSMLNSLFLALHIDKLDRKLYCFYPSIVTCQCWNWNSQVFWLASQAVSSGIFNKTWTREQWVRKSDSILDFSPCVQRASSRLLGELKRINRWYSLPHVICLWIDKKMNALVREWGYTITVK